MFRYLNTDQGVNRNFQKIYNQDLTDFALDCPNKDDGGNLLTLNYVVQNLKGYYITRDAVCAFHYGSFNYNLNTRNSDFDLIVVTMPSISDLTWNMWEPKCKEYTYPAGIIKEVDFRYFMKELIKGSNPNLMEVYFSKYLWVSDNPIFSSLTSILFSRFYTKMYYKTNVQELFDAYKGMAYSHAKKFEKDKNNKQYVNAVRCAEAAVDLITETPVFYFLTGTDFANREKLRNKKEIVNVEDAEVASLKAQLDTTFRYYSPDPERVDKTKTLPALKGLDSGHGVAFLRNLTETVFTDYLTKP